MLQQLIDEALNCARCEENAELILEKALMVLLRMEQWPDAA